MASDKPIKWKFEYRIKFFSKYTIMITESSEQYLFEFNCLGSVVSKT